ncbi:MAG: ATP-binding protein [Pseudomonadota bacterium]
MLKHWFNFPQITNDTLESDEKIAASSSLHPSPHLEVDTTCQLLRKTLSETLFHAPCGYILLGKNFYLEWFNPLATQWLGLKNSDHNRRITHIIRSPIFTHFLDKQEYKLSIEYGKSQLRFQLICLVPSHLFLLQIEQEDDREAIHRSQRDFLAAVSHELNTPITVIQGFLEILSAKYQEDKEIFQRLHQQTQRLTGLSSQLLQLLRAEQNLPKFKAIDAHTFFNRIKNDLDGSLLQSRRISWNIDNVVEIFGDELSLYSAFKNLIDNAIRYTDDQTGEIVISWYVAKNENNNGNNIFEVKDNGIGIDHHHLIHLGTRFYRAHDHATIGTGLGLSIVKQVIQAHKGNLEITSTVKAGSLFKLFLPSVPQSLKD